MSYKENPKRRRKPKSNGNKFSETKKKSAGTKRSRRSRKPLSKLPQLSSPTDPAKSSGLEAVNNRLLVPPPPPAIAKSQNSPNLFRSLKGNPQYVVEYLPYIFKHFRETEMKHHPRSDYLENQNEVTNHMRAILIDWLIDVHMKFKMKRETLFICVNIIDRFMSKVRVSRKRLQLVGCTALFIAAKYEEIYIPTIGDLERVCANTYTVNDFLKMEKMILNTLKYTLTFVTANQLLPIFMEATRSLPYCNDENRIKMMLVCEYVTEICMYEYGMLKYSVSRIAASSILFAGQIVFGDDFIWNDTFRYYIGYEANTLKECIRSIKSCIRKYSGTKNKLVATNRKYGSEKRGFVSRVVKSNLMNEEVFEEDDEL